MMDCPEVRELISAYIDGEVSESEKSNIERHLENCPGCRLDYEQTREIVKALHDIHDEELPQGFEAELHGRLKEVSRKKSLGRVSFINSPRLRALAGIAACLLIMFLARDVLFDGSLRMKKEPGMYDSQPQAMMRAAGREIPETTAAAMAPEALYSNEVEETDEVMSVQFSEAYKTEDANEETPDARMAPDGNAGTMMFGTGDITGSHLKVSIVISSSNPQEHLSQLESFAAGNGALILEANSGTNRLDFKIKKDKFAGIHEYLTNNYGTENVNYNSRIIEEPSYNIGELYERYNELASRMDEERSKDYSENEHLRLMAQKELLLDMIKKLEEERGSASVTVTFQPSE